MKVPETFREYIWLLNTIRKARKITFGEIQEKWLDTELSGGVEYAKSTFHRHKDAIQDIFGIYIECDRKNGYKYYIGNDHVLREDTVQNWMLSTLTVNNVVSESLAVQDRILLESVPEDDYLQIVIDAMKAKVRVAVKYRRYGTDDPSYADFEPYCIKLSGRRWYVLGHFHRDATPEKEERDYFAVYSFDRILEISKTDTKFEVDPDFDAKAFFDECYGVVVGDGTPAKHIVIRAYGIQRYYLRDLPLHTTQKEVGQGQDYADFAFNIRPTADFVGHLMSLGKYVKVLEPQSLIDEIGQKLQEAADLYKKN